MNLTSSMKLLKLIKIVKNNRAFLNKSGSTSIIYVVLIMILVMIVAGFVDVTGKVWTLNEFQSIADLTAHNVLYSSIDLETLRYEILQSNNEALDSEDLSLINNHIASNKYKQELIKQYESQLNESIKNSSAYDADFEVKTLDIKFQFVDWGIGDSSKARPQITMDTYIVVTSNGFGMFDNLTKFAINYTNAQTGSSQTIKYGNTTEDGKTILFIRNMTRLIYR